MGLSSRPFGEPRKGRDDLHGPLSMQLADWFNQERRGLPPFWRAMPWSNADGAVSSLRAR